MISSSLELSGSLQNQCQCPFLTRLVGKHAPDCPLHCGPDTQPGPGISPTTISSWLNAKTRSSGYPLSGMLKQLEARDPADREKWFIEKQELWRLPCNLEEHLDVKSEDLQGEVAEQLQQWIKECEDYRSSMPTWVRLHNTEWFSLTTPQVEDSFSTVDSGSSSSSASSSETSLSDPLFRRTPRSKGEDQAAEVASIRRSIGSYKSSIISVHETSFNYLHPRPNSPCRTLDFHKVEDDSKVALPRPKPKPILKPLRLATTKSEADEIPPPDAYQSSVNLSKAVRWHVPSRCGEASAQNPSMTPCNESLLRGKFPASPRFAGASPNSIFGTPGSDMSLIVNPHTPRTPYTDASATGSEMHAVWNEKFNTAFEEVRSELRTEFQQSHLTLRNELATHVKHVEEKQNNGLQSLETLMMNLHQSHLMLRDHPASTNSENLENRAPHVERNGVSLESALESASAHWQSQMHELRSDIWCNLEIFHKTLATLTEKVDSLEQAASINDDRHTALQAKVESSMNEKEEKITGLHPNAHSATGDALATLKDLALRAELAEDGRNDVRLASKSIEHCETSASIAEECDAGTLEDLRMTSVDVSEQVEKLKHVAIGELDLQMKTEANMGKIFNEHDKATAHVHEEVQLILNDIHAEVRAACRANKEEMKVAMQELTSKLMAKVQLNSTLTEALAKHASVVENECDRINSRLQSIEDMHNESLASTTESHEIRLRSVLECTQARLQEESNKIVSALREEMQKVAKATLEKMDAKLQEELQLLKNEAGCPPAPQQHTPWNTSLQQAGALRQDFGAQMQELFLELEEKIRNDFKKMPGGSPGGPLGGTPPHFHPGGAPSPGATIGGLLGGTPSPGGTPGQKPGDSPAPARLSLSGLVRQRVLELEADDKLPTSARGPLDDVLPAASVRGRSLSLS